MMIVKWVGACIWGVAVAGLFMLAVRREVRRVVARAANDPRRSRRRRALRWVFVSSALSLPALVGPVAIATLTAFIVTRNVWLRREVTRGA